MDSRVKLLQVNIRRVEPIGHMHVYESFADADKHLQGRCRALDTDASSTYSYRAVWERDFAIEGEFSIDSSMQDEKHIIQQVINLKLADDLLLYMLAPRRDDLRKMVLRLQWQMERLMQDQRKREKALDIITSCEGVDEKGILTGYEMLREMVDSVDLFLPLLKKVFPNAQQKLQNIRMLKNRSNRYIQEAIKDFQSLGIDVLSDALNNEEGHFEESWQKLVNFCVNVSEEQKYADERLTTIGRNIYYLSERDMRLIKDEAFGQIKPFSEEASREYFSRNKKIKYAYYNKAEIVPKRKSSIWNDLYLELYADGYIKIEAGRLSRLDISVYIARLLMSKHGITPAQIKNLIVTNDPLAVQFPAYADIVMKEACFAQ